jgi:hypothetical protein
MTSGGTMWVVSAILAPGEFLVLLFQKRNQPCEALVVDNASEFTSPARQLADRSAEVDIHDLPAGGRLSQEVVEFDRWLRLED